jgi:predicted Fe-S protein YdhL (DUF1289 family)
MSDPAAAALSPCVRNCCLDDDDTCLGCFRSLDEIKEWGTASHQRRLIILDQAQRRKETNRSLCRGDI